ncbi:MAG: Gfo/Idh/MocA family oxidoreductase [Paludibacteraceae bacterium]|nr:Gfo/Idh/MocA family oxidoreductase [Paludibacteraceae bacterium]
MKNIAILGCGNLGRRHLQSAVKTQQALNVYVYDINPDVFTLAKELLDGNPAFQGTSVSYVTELDNLPKKLDVVVIASSSSGRRKLIEDLLAVSEVKYLILEKVLFQSFADYDYVQNLIDAKKITTYVNCPRRYYPIYNGLKKTLQNKQFSFYLHGGNWGLACNFIHYLDLLSFLGGQTPIEIDISSLDDEIIDSKRAGYKEITGMIKGSIGNCNRFIIKSDKQNEGGNILFIDSDDEKIVIKETENLVYRISEDSMTCEKFKVLYQSELTEKYIESLLLNGTCGLTPYEESAILHKAFIGPLTDFFEQRGIKERLCPIT